LTLIFFDPTQFNFLTGKKIENLRFLGEIFQTWRWLNLPYVRFFLSEGEKIEKFGFGLQLGSGFG